MIVAIVLVSIVLFALFILAAIAGNRAQTRMARRDEAAREARSLEPPRSDG